MLAVHEDRLAAAVERLGSENAFEVLARARQLEARGRRVVHMEIGEPDFDTPEHIKKAAVDALYENHTHYTPSSGLPSLRDDRSPNTRAVSAGISPAVASRKRRRRAGRQAGHLEHAERATRSRRRVHLLRSGLSRVRVVRELPAGGRPRDPAARIAQLAHGSRRVGAPRLVEDQSRRDQFAAQSDRRRADQGRSRSSSRSSRSGTTSSSSPTRSTAATSISRASISRSRRCRACASARSSWTASLRRTR